MTTERATKTAPRIGLSGLEWKLLLAAALGAVYTASWLGVAGPRREPGVRAAAPAPASRSTSPAIARSPRPRDAAVRIRTRSS